MRKYLLLALLPLVSQPTFAGLGQADAVKGFYAARMANKNVGVPNGRELAAYSSFLDPELVCILGAALRYDERNANAKPGGTSLFAEADLYSSSRTIPTAIMLGEIQQNGDSASLPVRFRIDWVDSPDSLQWQDTIHLHKVRSSWRISDIEYGGGDSFENHGRLRENIRRQLETAPPVSGWSSRELEACTLDARPTEQHKNETQAKGSKNKAKSKKPSQGKTKKAKH